MYNILLRQCSIVIVFALNFTGFVGFWEGSKDFKFSDITKYFLNLNNCKHPLYN